MCLVFALHQSGLVGRAKPELLENVVRSQGYLRTTFSLRYDERSHCREHVSLKSGTRLLPFFKVWVFDALQYLTYNCVLTIVERIICRDHSRSRENCRTRQMLGNCGVSKSSGVARSACFGRIYSSHIHAIQYINTLGFILVSLPAPFCRIGEFGVRPWVSFRGLELTPHWKRV